MKLFTQSAIALFGLAMLAGCSSNKLANQGYYYHIDREHDSRFQAEAQDLDQANAPAADQELRNYDMVTVDPETAPEAKAPEGEATANPAALAAAPLASSQAPAVKKERTMTRKEVRQQKRTLRKTLRRAMRAERKGESSWLPKMVQDYENLAYTLMVIGVVVIILGILVEALFAVGLVLFLLGLLFFLL